MKFCEKCGKTIAILNGTNRNMCSNCSKHLISQDQSASAHPISDMLGECQLSVTDSQILLHSPEGWLLWNGDIAKSYTLASIATHADKILSIRSKRLKGKHNPQKKESK